MKTNDKSKKFDIRKSDAQATVLQPRFKNLEEALSYKPIPVRDTEIGRITLEMIDYFMNRTDFKC